jgi:TatD DNase family protein
MFTDTHAHLSFPDFSEDLPVVIERAQTAGVGGIVTVATGLEDARRALEIAGQFEGVYAAVGLHPGDEPVAEPASVRKLPVSGKIVAVGETGLDYYRGRAHKQEQRYLFAAHLAFAKEHDKPVIIHNREAGADLLEILREFRPAGVMHCFSGGEKFAFDCIELGLFISYSGILTFENAAALRAVAKAVPLENVLLETDCPYLAPQPYRGKRNEPAHIPLIAQALAQIKSVSVEEVARATTANACRLFRIPAP